MVGGGPERAMTPFFGVIRWNELVSGHVDGLAAGLDLLEGSVDWASVWALRLETGWTLGGAMVNGCDEKRGRKGGRDLLSDA